MIGEEKGSVAISGRSSHKMTGLVVEGQKLENCFLCSIPFEALRPGLKVAFYNVPNLMQISKDNRLS